jgi:hypothetical protein
MAGRRKRKQYAAGESLFGENWWLDDQRLFADSLVRQAGARGRDRRTVDELLKYVAQLGERADKVCGRAVGPDEDSMLKISGDGRRAALDLRLVGLEQQTPGKVTVAAERIATIWREHRDHKYRAPDGSSYAVRGSLQLVFCDLGTPGPGWNVYDDLR